MASTGTLAAGAAGLPDILVCVFQRGAADGMNSIVPYGDDDYYNLRTRIAVPPPGQVDGALDLDGFFGLHPAAPEIKTLYDMGRLAAIHATGVPHGSRSHFDAQALVEAAATDKQFLDTGWLARHLVATASPDDRPFRAVAISGAVPLSLLGAADPLAIDSIEQFGIGDAGGGSYEDTLQALYPDDRPYAGVAQAALTAIEELAIADPSQYSPDNGANYPASQLGGGLLQAGQLIKSDLGVEVICVDVGNWDHHENLPAVLPGSLADLAAALNAFHTDMGNRMEHITVLVQTEFGRRAADNVSSGTDHGTGGCAYLLGGGVIGAQVAGSWPGLGPGDLFAGEDLAITTDLRDVLAQMLQRRLMNPDPAAVFPGYAPQPAPELFLAK
ncbi:MAG: DUF1501 domain-containing protein [Gammaproteobacteria bacterium]|nr:DUF1501 domain-containing protein [Gammaproteobacteria bacterium]